MPARRTKQRARLTWRAGRMLWSRTMRTWLREHPLLALTLAGLLVRCLFLVLEPATHPVADERTWTNWAVEALVTKRVRFNPFRTRMIFHPPLYPYFIAVPYALFGTLAAVKWTQVVVGSTFVFAVGRVGEGVVGRRAGLAAAALAAFYPELVWFSVHFWSETLFMALLWWGFERLLATDDAPRLGSAAAAGALWGFTILTREVLLYFVPCACVWLVWRRRERLTVAAVFAGAALLVVAPWTWRNWVQFHALVPVSTAGGQNLFQGNALIPRDETYAMVDAVQGRVEQYRYATRMGLQAIRDRQPWWIFEKLRDEMPNFWEADSQALVHIKRGAYGVVPRPVALAAAFVVLVPYLALLALFVLGIAWLRFERRSALLLGFLVYYNLIHIVTHGYARYRLPALPVLFVVAGFAIASWRARATIAVMPARRAVVVVLALTLAASLVPSFRSNIDDPAFGLGERGEAGEVGP